MGGFMLYGDESGHTQVPNIFLDEYMPRANGEYVKIYLYLLRCLKSDTQELSISLIADRFERTESDVDRALKYWEKMHLLKLEYDESSRLSGVRLLDGQRQTLSDDSRTVTADLEAAKPKAASAPLTESEARQLFFVCERYIGRQISSTDTERLLKLHDDLGFSADLIEYLVEYCVSGGHRSIRYMEATAAGWRDEGIRTVEDAKLKAGTGGRAYFRILKAFGITDRHPVEAEIKYMDKWIHEYGFTQELIEEACNRTVAAIHQPSFRYADKILSTWKDAGVYDLKALKELDRVHASTANAKPAKQAREKASVNRFHNFDEREYDYSGLEKTLINK